MTEQLQQQPTYTQESPVGQQSYGTPRQSSGAVQRAPTGGRMSQPPLGQQGVNQQTPLGTEITEFDDELTDEMRVALHDFSKVAKAAEWAKDRSIDAGPATSQVVRVLQDVADLADMNEKLITRDSVNGPIVAEMYFEVATRAIDQLKQFGNGAPHLEQTAALIERSIESVDKLLATVGYQSPTGKKFGDISGQQLQRSRFAHGGRSFGGQPTQRY
jgi:hypothetical protein